MKKSNFDFVGAEYSLDFRIHFLEITRTPLRFFHRAFVVIGFVIVLFLFSLWQHAMVWSALAFTAVLFYQYTRIKKCGLGIVVERKLSTNNLAQGAQLRIDYEVTNNSPFSCPSFFIEDQTMYLAVSPSMLAHPYQLPPGQTVILSAMARIESPAGQTTMAPFAIRIRDELGLFEMIEYFDDDKPVEIHHGQKAHDVQLVHPQNSPIPGDLEIAKVGQGINLLTVREYRDGDPMNRINWARSTQDDLLFIKEFESDIARRVTIGLENRAHFHVGYGASSTWEVAKTLMTRLCGAYLKAQSSISIISNATRVKDLSGIRTLPYCERVIANLKLQYDMSINDLPHMSQYVVAPSLILWITPFDLGQVDDVLRQMSRLKGQGYEPHICYIDPVPSTTLVSKKFGSFREHAKKIVINRKEIEQRFARAEISLTWVRATQLSGEIEVSRHG